MVGFVEFVRKQGVVGLAIGFILGGAVQKVVSSLVEDIVNPLVGVILGANDSLAQAVLNIGPVSIRWGHFTSVMIDFLIIAGVVYYGFRLLGIEKLDKKRSK